MLATSYITVKALQETRPLIWFGLSVLLHIAVFVGTGGYADWKQMPSRQFIVQLDLQRSPADNTGPLAVPDHLPELEAPPPQPDPPRTELPDIPPSVAVTAPPSAFDLPLPLDDYLAARDVDIRAEPANEILLIYPLRAFEQRVAGKVRMTLLINEYGELDRAIVTEAQPEGIFEQAALEAVNKLQFSPAQKNGRNVKSRKNIEVMFDPYEHFAKPIPVLPNSSAAGR